MNETLIGIIASLGLGGLIGSWFQSYLLARTESKRRNREILEGHYHTMLMHMRLIIAPERCRHMSFGRESVTFRNEDEIRLYSREELEELSYHCELYASNEVMKMVNAFLTMQSDENYLAVAKAMRKHLWS